MAHYDDSSSTSEDSDDEIDGTTLALQQRAKRSCDYQPPAAKYQNFYGNPNTSPIYGNRMQMYCRTKHFLAIYPDGRVRGTMDKTDLHTHVELINAGYPGHLRIKGLLTNLYVAMNEKGRIYAEPSYQQENTIFIESVKGFYVTYLSRQYAYQGWYLAVKKSGKMKNGRKTALQQKAVQFLQRRKEFE